MNYIEWINRELNKLSEKTFLFEKSRDKNYTLKKILNKKFKCCLEFGVYNGTTINMISKKCNKVYGFDSFESLPEDWIGVCKKNRFIINQIPIVDDNVSLIKGWFNETLDVFLSKNNVDIDLIHIDCDLYSSTIYIFETLIKHNKIKKGLIIVFDELINYNRFFEGEIKALYEINQKYNINFDYLHTHGNIMKYNDILKDINQKMTFKDFRNKGYQQEVAIIIV